VGRTMSCRCLGGVKGLKNSLVRSRDHRHGTRVIFEHRLREPRTGVFLGTGIALECFRQSSIAKVELGQFSITDAAEVRRHPAEMTITLLILLLLASVGAIVWGAEAFAEHLGPLAQCLGTSKVALAILLAGAEPEELVTAVTASLRHSPAIALGDVVGANVTMCLVALGIGGLIAPLPFRGSALRYALLGLPLAAIGVSIAWNGNVSRAAGAVLILFYVAYVAAIWLIEKRPPALGEVGELEEAGDGAERPLRDIALVLGGLVAMVLGATALVEAARRLTHVESSQTLLGLTIVGFATGFELVVLAWSASRRGASEIVVAGVVGSFAYNMTMTLGAAALARPLALTDATSLHRPLAAMMTSFAVIVFLALVRKRIDRLAGGLLLMAYPLTVWFAFLKRS